VLHFTFESALLTVVIKPPYLRSATKRTGCKSTSNAVKVLASFALDTKMHSRLFILSGMHFDLIRNTLGRIGSYPAESTRPVPDQLQSEHERQTVDDLIEDRRLHAPHEPYAAEGRGDGDREQAR